EQTARFLTDLQTRCSRRQVWANRVRSDIVRSCAGTKSRLNQRAEMRPLASAIQSPSRSGSQTVRQEVESFPRVLLTLRVETRCVDVPSNRATSRGTVS